jgi:hypothetical protein
MVFIRRKRWPLTDADCTMQVNPRSRGLMAAASCVLCLVAACHESGSGVGGRDGGTPRTNDVGTSTSAGADEVGLDTRADAGPSRDVSVSV